MPTALITGASGGIGEALARELARRKFDVVLAARSEDKLNQLAAAIQREHAVRTTVLVSDLTAPGAAVSLLERVRENVGQIDVLVNNAGFALHGAFNETDLAVEIDMIRLNVEVLTELTKRFLPDLLVTHGKIMNLGSTASFQPGPMMAVYYATKAYVLSFSEALASELAGTGVTVTCLCPGPTKSGFQARAHLEGARLVAAGLMSAESVARKGVDGMLAGRRLVIPGVLNWLGAQGVRFAPRRLTPAIVKWLHRKPGTGH
jgi:short-subunit dehydrogenase